MMPAFGSYALLLALALSVYTLCAGTVALRQLAIGPGAGRGTGPATGRGPGQRGRQARIAPERLAETARRAGIGSFVAVTGAAFALIWAAFTNDFSVSYILHHSNRALPIPYKFAALWSGQEGSLLLWAWLLAIYGFVLRLRHKTDVKLFAYASTILAGIQVFFLVLINFVAPPFSLVSGTISASTLCCNIRRWSSIRRCCISAMWAFLCHLPSRWAH
jgi:cytochrome c-type biogenesis protein CcmF